VQEFARQRPAQAGRCFLPRTLAESGDVLPIPCLHKGNGSSGGLLSAIPGVRKKRLKLCHILRKLGFVEHRSVAFYKAS